MAEFQELTQALAWLITNKLQKQTDYTHGLLGDGVGRVRVSTTPGSPDIDYVFARPDRFSGRVFKVFNKRVEGQDGDPIIIGTFPWEPDLIQVLDVDWQAYADVGWGDNITNTSRHGLTHQWQDGAPGLDTFDVYRRQFGDLKTYALESGTLSVGVSPYSLDIYGVQHQWPGTHGFSLSGAVPPATGTAQMALVYWSPASGTVGFLGIETGTVGSSADATLLNRPVTPQGAIPSAFVKLRGGQTSITEFDIWDAREPFRPGISFGTGTAQLNASLIPIIDAVGFYTGTSVESALQETPYKLIASDGSINPVFSADILGNVTLAGTGTIAIPELLIHSGDPDTKLTFTDDDIEFTVGGLSMLKLTETAQDVVDIGDVAGGGDIDVRFNAGQMFLEGSSGFFGIGTSTLNGTLQLESAVMFDPDGSGVATNLNIMRNGYKDAGGFKRLVADNDASLIQMDSAGNIAFSTNDDANVAVDSAITFTAKLFVQNNGDIGIGTFSPSAQLDVDQASTTAAQPVLRLDQADISEQMRQFETTIGTGNAIEAAGSKLLTVTHFVKDTLPGGLTRYTPYGTIGTSGPKFTKNETVTTQGLGANPDVFAFGNYEFSAADANLTQASTTQTFGTANISYATHAFAVTGGAGSVDAGVVGLRVNGTSIDDQGTRTTSDTETIIADITAAALNDYQETSKKWLGTVTYELFTVSGSPTTFSLDFNYGRAKYDDWFNTDFTITDIEAVGFAGANDAAFDIKLMHHQSSGWTYSAAAFTPITAANTVASLATDHSTDDQLLSGEHFAWKRDNLSEVIDGADGEGFLVFVSSSANNAVEYLNIHIGVTF